MKLHELKQRRNTIAAEMRTLHDTIGDAAWTDEQRTEWNKAKTELDSLDAQIQREDELRHLDQQLVNQTESEQRGHPAPPETALAEKRAASFDKYLRHGLGEMTPEERQALRELRAQGTTPDEKGGYTVPVQMLNKVVEAMKAYGGIASVAQILSTSTGQTIEWATADGTTEEGELLGENTAASEEDTLFGTESLGAKKLSSKIIRVSNELLLDSGIDMEAYLAKRIAERIGRGEARYLVKGTGTGSPQQPKGLETSVTGTVDAATKFSWKDRTP